MKVKLENLSEQERVQTLDALYTAAASVNGRDAMKLFLRDLLTESERLMLGRRIIVARLLLSGATYEDISLRMGVGKDTIGRIDRWLSDKAPGYENAVEGVQKAYARRKRKKAQQEFEKDPTWRNAVAVLKKKYPLHFLLFPWPKGYR